MRFLDLFSGIGGFRLGLERAGHECVGYVEWDKYARKSYEAIHNTEGEWTRHDITEISNDEWLEIKDEVDIVVGGSPCQAFSIAGNRLGFDDTRGTMFFYYANAIKQTQPDYFMFENVKGLLSHDKGTTIKTILSTFDEIGYAVDFDVFNSKYYGVPQNRERIFIVGKRKDLADDNLQIPPVGKKTLDKIKQWASENVQLISLLPQNDDLKVTTRLRDILEPVVDKKFYLSEEQTAKLVFNMENMDGSEPKINVIGNTSKTGYRSLDVYDTNGLASTIQARDYKGAKQILEEPLIGASRGRNPNNPSDRRTGSPTEQRLEINQDGVSNTLTTVQKDNYVVEGLPIREATKQGYSVAKDGDSVNIQYPTSTTRRGRVGNQIANTIQAGETNQGVVDQAYRIRKLSPLECFRLQAFPDSAYYAAEEVNSNSQLYKQAGNSVTVNVIEAIAKRLE